MAGDGRHVHRAKLGGATSDRHDDELLLELHKKRTRHYQGLIMWPTTRLYWEDWWQKMVLHHGNWDSLQKI